MLGQAHAAAWGGLTTSLKEVEKQIKQMIQQDAVIEKNYELLRSVPGIGHLAQIAAKWAVIGVFVGFEFFRVSVCVLQIFFF